MTPEIDIVYMAEAIIECLRSLGTPANGSIRQVIDDLRREGGPQLITDRLEGQISGIRVSGRVLFLDVNSNKIKFRDGRGTVDMLSFTTTTAGRI